MLVELKVGASTYTLAHGVDHGVDKHTGPGDDGSNDLRRSIQVDPIIDAAAPTISNRKNLTGRWSFTVQCRKTSLDAAADYKFRYPIELPGQGDVWVTEGTKIVKLLSAGIESVRTAQYGIVVFITYSIVYGAVEFAEAS